MQRVKEKARGARCPVDIGYAPTGTEWRRDERIRKLMERRQSFEAVGGLTGGERAVPFTAGTKGESQQVLAEKAKALEADFNKHISVEAKHICKQVKADM